MRKGQRCYTVVTKRIGQGTKEPLDSRKGGISTEPSINKTLKYADRLKSSPQQKLASWMAEISEYDYTVQIKKWEQMKISDCLSGITKILCEISIVPETVVRLKDSDDL